MKQTVLFLCIALCVSAAAAADAQASMTSMVDSFFPAKAAAMAGYRYGVSAS